jgi:hypothetical protein
MFSRIFKEGYADMVRITLMGEVIQGPYVVIFKNGMVNVKSNNEFTTMHISNCEVLWTVDNKKDNLRVIK